MLNFNIHSYYKFPETECLNNPVSNVTEFIEDCIQSLTLPRQTFTNINPLKIPISEIDTWLDFFKLTLNVQNNRPGPRRHTITIVCKKRIKENCKFKITITRTKFQKDFELYQTNRHETICLIQNEIKKRVVTSQISKLTETTNFTVKSQMQILSAQGIDVETYKNAIYNKHNLLTKKRDIKDKFSITELLGNLSKLDGVNDNIVKYNHINNGSSFYVMVANEKLISSMSNFSTFAIDGTYKLLFIDMCLVVFGGIDLQHKFTPLFFCICPNEDKQVFTWLFKRIEEITTQKSVEFIPKNIVGDGSTALSSVVAEIYPDSVKINCWAHISRKINQKVKSISKENGNKIFSDICFLQRSITPTLFNNAFRALKMLWNNFPEYSDFIVYFEDNYIKKNFTWFEGCRPGVPKTNNALEGFNLALKKTHFNWSKNYLIPFISKLGTILETKATEFGEPNGFTKFQLSYSRDEFEEINSREHFIDLLSETGVTYYLYTNEETVDEANLKKLACRCLKGVDNTLNYVDVKKVISTPILIAKPLTGVWEDFSCSCISYRRKMKCSHIFKLVHDKFASDALNYNVDALKKNKKRKIEPRSSLMKE